MSTFSTKGLFDACEKGDITRIRRAIAGGVDVRKVVDNNRLNRTPLHYASWYVACETHPLYTMPVCMNRKGYLAYDPMSSIRDMIGAFMHTLI